VPGYDKYKQHVLANPVFIGGELKSQPSLMNSNPFYHLQGAARPYTAEQWEQKLCKGENSLLAQKKRKIKERAEKGVPDLEAPMRTSRVIKATPPKEQEKYFYMYRGREKTRYGHDGDVWIISPEKLITDEVRHRLNQIGSRLHREEGATRKMSAKAKKDWDEYYVDRTAKYLSFVDAAYRTPSNSDVNDPNSLINRVARIAQNIFKDKEHYLSQYSFPHMKKVSAEEYAKLKREGRILKEGSDIWDARTSDEITGKEGSGMMANSQFYRTDPKRNPLLRGEGIWDDIKSGIEKVVGKPPISAHHVWTPAEQADINRRQRIIDVDKQRAKYIAQKKQVAVDDLMKNAQYPNVLKALYGQQGADNAKDYLARIVERATQGAERMYPY
jgi:hypothetical protein